MFMSILSKSLALCAFITGLVACQTNYPTKHDEVDTLLRTTLPRDDSQVLFIGLGDFWTNSRDSKIEIGPEHSTGPFWWNAQEFKQNRGIVVTEKSVFFATYDSKESKYFIDKKISLPGVRDVLLRKTGLLRVVALQEEDYSWHSFHFSKPGIADVKKTESVFEYIKEVVKTTAK